MSEPESTHGLGGGAAAAQALAVAPAAQVLAVREIAEGVAARLTSAEMFRLATTSGRVRAALQAVLRPRLLHRVAESITPAPIGFPPWQGEGARAEHLNWAGSPEAPWPDSIHIRTQQDRVVVNRYKVVPYPNKNRPWAAVEYMALVDPRGYKSGRIISSDGAHNVEILPYGSQEELAALLAPFFEGGPRPPA